MSTFTIRVTSSATNVAGTAYGQQPDLLAPSFFDMIVTGSSDPLIPNGVYDAYCLNPTIDINLSPTAYLAQNSAGNALSSYVPIGFGSLTQAQVDQINWLLAQNFTSDPKYGGQYNFGEVQVALWKLVGFSDAVINSQGLDRFLNDNNRNVVNVADIAFMQTAAQNAVASGNGVLPTDAFFTTIIDPAGNIQPLIVQLQSAKLGNFVWFDSDTDGIQDAGEVGVNNVIVELYNSSNVLIASTVTGDDFSTAAVEQGYYQFTGLKAGDYQVKFVAPTYLFTVQDANANGQDAADSDANAATGRSHIVNLTAGESDQTVDAGIYQNLPASIGDYVWVDTNNDGQQNDGATGLNGVTVNLRSAGGALLASTVTATNAGNAGYYLFANLVPGDYKVEFIKPAGYAFATQDVGSDASDSDANTGTGLTITTTLTSGENDLSWDAGLVQLASIGDRVWVDSDANGQQDAGELGKSGVTVELYTCVNNLPGVLVGSQVTDAMGNYNFTGLLPGDYIVKFITPAGFTLSTANVGADATDSDAGAGGLTGCYNLSPGENETTVDAGYYQTASIGNRVWVDSDADGVQDPGEANVAGVRVYLLNQLGATIGTKVTDANGNYLFENLTPGTYSIKFDLSTLPAGYVATIQDALLATDASDSDANAVTGATIQTVLESGEVDLSWDLGIKGNIGIDIEKLVHGEYLVQGSGGGEGLTPGFWKNHSIFGPAPLSGWPETGLSPTASYEAIFGVDVPASAPTLLDALGTNGGGVNALLRHSAAALLNAANPYVDYAYTQAQIISMVQAAFANGTYETTKDLFANQNELGADLSTPAGGGTTLVVTPDVDADTPGSGPVIPVGGKAVFTYIVTNTGSVELSNIAVTDDRIASLTFVGGDTDNDGRLDVNETWTYTAMETVQSNTAYVNIGTVVGRDVVSGTQVTDNDAAHYTTPTLGQSIGDRIWYDNNANGIQDAGEAGVAGVTVELRDNVGTFGNILATTVTDANGNYLFNVSNPGNYHIDVVESTLPAGYEFTLANQGANDGKDSDVYATGAWPLSYGIMANTTLTAGENDLSWDAGIFKRASLGDYVWVDSNNNGRQDDGATGLNGVTVRLYNGASTLVATTVTTTNAGNAGYYLFANLVPGDYKVEFVKPAGYAFAQRDIGTDSGDSDADSTTGMTVTTTLVSGENDLSWDAGLILQTPGIDIEKLVHGEYLVQAPGGGEGLTPGFWKNHSIFGPAPLSGWPETGLSPTASYEAIFGVDVPASAPTLLDALGTEGGGVNALLRHSAAALLNASNPYVDYAYTQAQVIAMVQAAFANGTYETTKDLFATQNELGADLSTPASGGSTLVVTPDVDADTPGSGPVIPVGGKAVFTYIVTNTGSVELSNIAVTDDRIANLTFVGGDTDNDGRLDVNETWRYTAMETVLPGTAYVNIGTVVGRDIVSGRQVTDNDAAHYTTPTVATKASIGNFVWEDKNYNGLQDAGEAGIANVTVKLLNNLGTVLATTTTGVNGEYLFSNLNPADYKVQVVAPSGYFTTKKDQGANDGVDSDIDSTGTTVLTTLSAGENDLSWDAGFYRKASVGDKVWEDKNHNNIQDAGEPGVGNIRVALLSSTGVVLATTTTNASGNYLFANLNPGVYAVQFDKANVMYNSINMNTWKWAYKDVGSNDAVDSDVTGNGVATTNLTKTDNFTLVSGQNDLTRDAGITPIVIDLDGNGIQTISRADATAGFDLFGNGGAVKSGWISAGDAFLAVDKNGNGRIDGIGELFGGTAKGAGFASLAGYDSNGDGLASDADTAFGQLMVWRDANGNHATDAGELLTLAEAGITSLSVGYNELPFLDRQGNLHLERSSATLSDGSSVDMTDVYFNVSAQDAAAAGVTLPSLADLLGDQQSLEALLGSDGQTTVNGGLGGADEAQAGADAGEVLRRIAALSRDESSHLSAA